MILLSGTRLPFFNLPSQPLRLVLGTRMVCELLQPKKALSPIDVTEFGIVIAVKARQPEKALFPIDVTEFGIVIAVKARP